MTRPTKGIVGISLREMIHLAERDAYDKSAKNRLLSAASRMNDSANKSPFLEKLAQNPAIKDANPKQATHALAQADAFKNGLLSAASRKNDAGDFYRSHYAPRAPREGRKSVLPFASGSAELVSFRLVFSIFHPHFICSTRKDDLEFRSLER